MGGYLAAHYANKYPQHIERLIMLSPLCVSNHVDLLDSSFKPKTLMVKLLNMYLKMSSKDGKSPS